MWYKLEVDYKKAKYKISETKKCDELEIAILEKEAKENPTIYMQANFHNEKYYFSQNKEALIRKVEELGWIYAEQLKSIILEEKKLVEHLKREIERLQETIDIREVLKDNILKEFSNYVHDCKKILINNISKLNITDKGAERIKKNIELETDYNSNDILNYCRKIILNDNSMVYSRAEKWYVELNHVQIMINSNNYKIITAHNIY